jgi:uncharacterized protein
MPRPCCTRTIGFQPSTVLYKPAGVPARMLDFVVLTLDEMETLRLADMLGMYQADAAERMGISRSTFGRIVEEARRKLAHALINGMAIRIEGGSVHYQHHGDTMKAHHSTPCCGNRGAGRKAGWRHRESDTPDEQGAQTAERRDQNPSQHIGPDNATDACAPGRGRGRGHGHGAAAHRNLRDDAAGANPANHEQPAHQREERQ